MLFASTAVREKIKKIRQEHQRPYQISLFIRIAILLVFSGMLFVGATLTWLDDGGGWVSFFLMIGIMGFGYSVKGIFELGNRDDREYFLKCIKASENEYQLDEMGFPDTHYEHIKDIVFATYINGDFVGDPADDHHIRLLHDKYDLREIADEINKRPGAR